MRKRLTVTVFRPSDYVEALAASHEDVSLRVSSPKEIGRLYAKYGPAYTIWIDDRIAACMGVMIPWDGHGDGWAVWTPVGLRNPRLLHSVAKSWFQKIIKDYKLRRVQADVIANFDAGRRWAEHMGLNFEGLMPAYGPMGETFARFAWIRPQGAPSCHATTTSWGLEAQDIPSTDDAALRGVMTEDGRFIPAISGGYDGGASIYIMIALTVAAAAASAYAQYSASEAQSQAMKYNAAESERQAEIADQQARFRAQQQAEADRRERAKARAIFGTSGVEVGEGSSLLVDLDSARQAELNYQSIRYQGEGQVRALTSQAVLDRFQARSTQQQGLIGAGSTLLSGFASAAGKIPSSAPKTITVPDISSAQARGYTGYSGGGRN